MLTGSYEVYVRRNNFSASSRIRFIDVSNSLKVNRVGIPHLVTSREKRLYVFI